MAQTGDRNEGDIEAELRPYVDRSLAPHAWRGSAIRARRAREAMPRASRARSRRCDSAVMRCLRAPRRALPRSGAATTMPMRCPRAGRSATRSARQSEAPLALAPRPSAVADILEVSPYFDWFASSEALEAQRALDEAKGEYFSDRFYRAFNRPDLARGTYTKANVGLIAPKEAPLRASAPHAVCADARGWAALLWGHPRNRWEWEDPEPFVFSDHPSDLEYMRRYDAARECGDYIEITYPVVGVSFFTALREFDGLALNAAAGRLLGLDETQVQWLGASAWKGGPYWDDHVSSRDMAEVCRAVARGEDARDAWYARRLSRLSLEGHYPSFPPQDESAQGPLDRTPAFAERPSALIAHALGAARTLDRGRYRPNARVFHRWNASLGACEVDLAGMVLAGTFDVSARASADAVWAHMLRREGAGPALRALREIGIGDVHGAVGTLGCWTQELRHRKALEALARWLEDLGL